MAIRVTDEFGSRANPPDAAYPDGSLKNETNPGVSNDGSPLEARVGNDWEGFKQSTLLEAGVVANGNPDSVDNPQILNAIKSITDDRFSYDGLVYQGVGNISDYAGQQLQEEDKTNCYQFPDDSREFYGPVQSQAFPITIPADPSNDNSWELVNALTSRSLPLYTDIVYKASGGNSAIENMIDGNPIPLSVGDKGSTGHTSWERIAENGNSSDFKALSYISTHDYGIVGDRTTDETQKLSELIALFPNRIIEVPEFSEIKIDTSNLDLSLCSGIVGNGGFFIEATSSSFVNVSSYFFIDGLSFDGEVNHFDAFQIQGGKDGSDDSTWAENITIRNCNFRNSHPEGVAQQYLCFQAARMKNLTYVNNRVTRGASWFREQLGVLIDGNNINADRAGYLVRNTTAGADCIKLTGGSWGVISNNILENAGRDGIDAFSAGNNLSISGNTIRGFYTEGIEIKSVDGGGEVSRYISITGNVITDGGYDSSAPHAAVWIDDNESSDSIHDITVVGNTISNIGFNAGAGALYTGVRCTNAENANISNNVITNIYSENYTEYAIDIAGLNQGIVSGNIITGDERGISAGTLRDTIICNNKITTNRTTGSNTDIGLYFSANQQNVRVEGNTIHSNGRAINAEGTTWDKVFVSNNTLLSNSGNIVWLGDLINCSFTGNYIESTVSATDVDGLYMSSSADEGTIIANNILKNCRYGIYLRNSIGAIVTGNRGENIDYTVYVVGGDYNIIKNNIAINANFNFQPAIGANSIVSDNLRVV